MFGKKKKAEPEGYMQGYPGNWAGKCERCGRTTYGYSKTCKHCGHGVLLPARKCRICGRITFGRAVCGFCDDAATRSLAALMSGVEEKQWKGVALTLKEVIERDYL
jgi:hypothetical protein